MKSNFAKLLAIATLGLGFAGPSYASIGFTGDYAPGTWSLVQDKDGGTTSVFSGAPTIDTLTFTGGNTQDGCPDGTGTCNRRLLNTALSDGTISFDWLYRNFDEDICCEVFGFGINGSPNNPPLGESALTTSGSRTVSLLAGDVFEFYYNCTDCLEVFGGGDATITNFVFTEDVGQAPEPTSIALLGIGLIGLGASRLRARRS